MKYDRQLKYYYLRFIRLRGEPRDLALGIALGIFVGMMPIMPFQIAFAVMLAIFFKGSKITAALGTWVSNPLNWAFLYYLSYRIGASLLGLAEKNAMILSVMRSIHQGDETMVVLGKIAGAGGAILSSFLFGGFLLGAVAAVPSYFIFLRIFQIFESVRKKKKAYKRCQEHDQ